ncbi:MAG: sensor histidine kinase [Lachnospiraceae bacterium]|nr:sensor histidine kinase [Lachnospiraceae bacterium]
MKEVLRKNRLAVALFLVMEALNLVVFVLYDIMVEPFLYAAVLGCAIFVIMLVAAAGHERRRAEERRPAVVSIQTEWQNLPRPASLLEMDYQAMIEALGRELDRVSSENYKERQDMTDYYTTWVHQIKTPIAVMKLKLSEDTPENRALGAELFRIEQYVDMVLQYVRLGSGSHDLMVQEVKLNDVVRESVRKYTSQFIEKRLRLEVMVGDEIVITDQKWLACILDQLISNAVKYTATGGVRIFVENHVLKIADTGIGIAPEDLPRIFEKGYTGLNGRIDKKASGLGLYLAKKAADMINLPLTAGSVMGEGSTFSLDFNAQTSGQN